MKRYLITALISIFAGTAVNAASAANTAPDFKLVDTIKIGGAAKWDYIYMDSSAHRLYVSHGTQTEVIDTQTSKVVGTIADTLGVHGIAVADDLGIGFTSNGANESVSVFDLTTLKTTATVKVGNKPDAILYVPAMHKVVVFNGKSNNVSIIDAKTLKVTATIKVPGKPEFAVLGADGNVYFNVEDISRIAMIDMTTSKLKHSSSLKPCDEPSGLAIDAQQNLFSVCANNLMMVTNTAGKIIAKVKIGSGPDGVVFMDGYALSANGSDGTMTAVAAVNGHFEPVATVPTQFGARTIAADPATHRVYLPTADFQAGSNNDSEKRKVIEDTFQVLVLEKQ